jgi:hypothetical protein
MIWFILFAAAVFGLYFWREYSIRQKWGESGTSATRSGERHIGMVLKLTTPIRGGRGRIRLGTREWSLRGPDLPTDTAVRITGIDGDTLIVDRAPADS